MKDYKWVVKERYDKEMFDRQAIADNMYSLINPVGFYGEHNSVKILTHFINLLDEYRKIHDEIRILDCGCGVGIKTRIMAELIGKTPEEVALLTTQNARRFYRLEYRRCYRCLRT